MPFFEERAIFRGMCHIWRKVTFWINMQFLDKYVIWMNLPYFGNVPFLEKCIIFEGECTKRIPTKRGPPVFPMHIFPV